MALYNLNDPNVVVPASVIAKFAALVEDAEKAIAETE